MRQDQILPSLDRNDHSPIGTLKSDRTSSGAALRLAAACTSSLIRGQDTSQLGAGSGSKHLSRRPLPLRRCRPGWRRSPHWLISPPLLPTTYTPPKASARVAGLPLCSCWLAFQRLFGIMAIAVRDSTTRCTPPFNSLKRFYRTLSRSSESRAERFDARKASLWRQRFFMFPSGRLGICLHFRIPATSQSLSGRRWYVRTRQVVLDGASQTLPGTHPCQQDAVLTSQTTAISYRTLPLARLQ